ncbi:MAG: hypothetical protein PHP74_02355 [Candidatus Gracilibacteria bacterium]|nr:hypothetical protein [Candidatus Gracilibacteria bacterium]
MLKSFKKIKKINANFWFYALMGFVAVVLIAIRAFPYILHGPFGFGYDTGIYKKVFEEMTSFFDIFSSQIYVLPAGLAYLFNLLHIPSGFLLYFSYILFSVLIAWPLYLLTKEFFGKTAGLVAVAIFAVSYVQVFASVFYLFKEMLGAVFMLFGFLYYARKSRLFYLFAILLVFTQLPLFLVLAVGTGLSMIVNFKKDLKFNLKAFGIVVLGLLFLAVFTPSHLIVAWDVVTGAFINSSSGFSPHQSGSFISIKEFIYREWLFLGLGVLGFIFAIREKKLLFLNFAVVFLAAVVFFELFFERRFVIPLSLLSIPYAGYFVSVVYEKFLKKYSVLKYLAVIVFVLIILIATRFHYRTTYPALNAEEQWALQTLIDKADTEYVMATNSYYAPWLYGFSGKTTLAPGIFISPWDIQKWNEYNAGSNVVRSNMLIKVANEYGKFYVLEGVRQPYTRADKGSPLIKRIFDVNGARIYEVSPSEVSYGVSSESSASFWT